MKLLLFFLICLVQIVNSSDSCRYIEELLPLDCWLLSKELNNDLCRVALSLKLKLSCFPGFIIKMWSAL